jgi:hypothetical protein
MADDNTVLERIGKLSGLMELNLIGVNNLATKQDAQHSILESVQTDVAVMKSNCTQRAMSCGVKFAESDKKLTRDYDRLNIIEEGKKIENGVRDYKVKRMNWWQQSLMIIAIVFGLILSANQLAALVNKIHINPPTMQITPK